jgi:hypothetical protein
VCPRRPPSAKMTHSSRNQSKTLDPKVPLIVSSLFLLTVVVLTFKAQAIVL